MSRKHKRLESFREVVRQRSDTPTAVKPLTCRDRLGIWAVILTGLAVMLGTPLLNLRARHRNSIESRVQRWGKELQLLPEEIDHLKEEEFLFHGTGNPFALMPEITEQDNKGHYQRLLSHVRKEISPMFENKLQTERNH